MTICPKSTIKRKGSSTTTHSSVEPYNGTLDCIKSKEWMSLTFLWHRKQLSIILTKDELRIIKDTDTAEIMVEVYGKTNSLEWILTVVLS